MSIFNDPAGKTTDVAGRKAAGKEVVWAKDNIEVLFNNTAELIWAIDKERYYLYTNSAYRDAVFAETGITPKEGDHIYLNNEFSTGQIQEWEKYYNRAFRGGAFTARTESVDNKTGRPVYFEVSFNPLCRTKGKVTSIGCFARNITDLVKTEKAIIDQNERLRNIASISSHELRRPVASLLGLINIIDKENFDSPDNKEIIDHLLTVGKEIDDVIRLIINKTFADDPSVGRYQTP
jgi:PAS domain S-box-containing protein